MTCKCILTKPVAVVPRPECSMSFSVFTVLARSLARQVSPMTRRNKSFSRDRQTGDARPRPPGRHRAATCQGDGRGGLLQWLLVPIKRVAVRHLPSYTARTPINLRRRPLNISQSFLRRRQLVLQKQTKRCRVQMPVLKLF